MVERWTGRETRALRHALRMTVQGFAAHLGVSPRTVSKWESRGADIEPLPELQAVLDTALKQSDDAAHQRFSMFADVGQQQLSLDALAYPHSSREGVQTVVALWADDLARRSFMGGAFAAAGFAVPALRWATRSGEAGSGDRGRGGPGPSAEGVQAIRESAAMFRRIDNEFGGGMAREQTLQFLQSRVQPMLQSSSMSRRLEREMFSAAAELTHVLAWMTYDSGAWALAQRYSVQALRLAQAGEDTALAAEILSGMSHQLTFHGHPAEAIDLARVAASAAATADDGALMAEALVMEARGHAARGDEAACVDVLTRAEGALTGAEARSTWQTYFDGAYFAAQVAHCERSLGNLASARREAEASLDMQDGYARGKAFNTALLGSVLGQQGDLDGALAAGRRALDLGGQLRSNRLVGYVKDVVRTLGRRRHDDEVASLTARLGELPGALAAAR